jgi:hypothetical protein
MGSPEDPFQAHFPVHNYFNPRVWIKIVKKTVIISNAKLQIFVLIQLYANTKDVTFSKYG